VKLLQRALGIADDGVIGPQTITKLALTPICALVLRFNAEREEFYTGLPTWGSFGKGWSRRVASNLRYAAQDI
jgi:lysozyme family protein